MAKTKIECKGCSGEFSPHKHKVTKGAAVGTAAVLGAKVGGGFGIISGWLPGGATGARVGAALAGGAKAFGAKSVTKCLHCDKHHLI